MCLISILGFLFVGLVCVLYHYDLDNYEGIVIEPALRIASGQPAFGSDLFLNEPYSCPAYGPLYYIVLGAILRVMGLVFWPGRLISLLATIATALLLYRSIKGEWKLSAGGLVAVTVFLMSPATWPYGFMQRVDALGVAFAFLCVVLAMSPGKRSRNLLLSGCAVGLAFFIKPTLIAAGATVMIWLVIARAQREIAAFFLGGALVFAIGLAVLFLTGNAGFISNQLVNANTHFSGGLVVSIIHMLSQNHIVIAATVLTALLLLRPGFSLSAFGAHLPLIYLLVSACLSLLECGKNGASTNYFYEFFVALALCSGLAFAQIEKEGTTAFKLAAILLILSFAAELAIHSYTVRVQWSAFSAKAELHEKIVQELIEYVPVGEPVASHYPDLVLKAGRQLYFTDIYMYLLGPDDMCSILSSHFAEKKLAAYISMGYETIPGYTPVGGLGYKYPYPTSVPVQSGPILYLRDDLWRKREQSRNYAP